MKPIKDTNPPASIPQRKRSSSLHRSLVSYTATVFFPTTIIVTAAMNTVTFKPIYNNALI